MGQQESPKANEEKYTKVADAWATEAPNATFGGMTLSQFQERIRPSQDARSEIGTLEKALDAAQTQRDTADIATMNAVDLVVKGVVGAPEFGDDSHLYGEMGYVRKSQRKSGLTRKKKDGGQTASTQ